MNDLVIPKLRNDIVFDFVEDEVNGKHIVLFDPSGYADRPVYLPGFFLDMLKLLNGELSLKELNKTVSETLNLDFDDSFFLELFKHLDEYCFLETPRFNWRKYDIDKYLESPKRNYICGGSTYPLEYDKLKESLGKLLDCNEQTNSNQNAKAIIVPHIDFNIGVQANSTYSTAYNAIKNTDADLFVIFGTSHYGNSDLFMLTKKDFETPLGLVENDKELISFMQRDRMPRITIDDLSHRNEHSIELQAVILKHLFGKRKFKILPVLCGSFHNFIRDNTLPNSEQKFVVFIDKLKQGIESLGRKAVFIASADFAHIGRKFGDNFDAAPMLDIVRNEDLDLINQLENCNQDAFFKLVTEAKDKRKICGLSPIYAMLHTVKPGKGHFLKYEQWNEIETKSAVSFASLSFYE